MRISRDELATLGGRRATRRGNSRVKPGGGLPVPGALWVPGRLVNPLNHRRGWRAVWATSKTSRQRTAHAFVVYGPEVAPETPKIVTFTANVGAEWDDDNLRAAIKPHRDGLKDAGIINDDKPSAGHVFVYTQRIDRAHPGVWIRVCRLAGVAPASPASGPPEAR